MVVATLTVVEEDVCAKCEHKVVRFQSDIKTGLDDWTHEISFSFQKECPGAPVAIPSSVVCDLDVLRVGPLPDDEPDVDFRGINTDLCYICGKSNYEGDHLDEDGFKVNCPTGITRMQADVIRHRRARANGGG